MIPRVRLLVTITPPTPTALAYDIQGDLPAAVVGDPFEGLLTAKGGGGGYTFAGTDEPPGLTVDSDGKVVGTPTDEGFYEFSGTVTDTFGNSITKTFGLQIKSGVKVAGFFPAAEEGIAYSVTLTASGGTGPYTWSHSGSLPPGVTRTTNTLSGTPTTPGTYLFKVTATDANGLTGDYHAQVVVAPPVTLSGTFPAGIIGVAYAVQLHATDGVEPYAYTRSAGTLNSGLTLTPTGLVFGVPTATESQALTFTVTDALGASGTLSVTLDTATAGGGGVSTTETGILVRGGSLQSASPPVGTTTSEEVRGISTGDYDYINQTWRLWVYPTPALGTTFELDVFLRPFGNTAPSPTDSICASAVPAITGNASDITAFGSTATWVGTLARGDMLTVRPRLNTAGVKWWSLEIDTTRTL